MHNSLLFPGTLNSVLFTSPLCPCRAFTLLTPTLVRAPPAQPAHLVILTGRASETLPANLSGTASACASQMLGHTQGPVGRQLSLSSECRHLSPHFLGTSAPSWRFHLLALRHRPTPELCHPAASIASYFQSKTSLTNSHWTQENCLELEPCCPLHLMPPLPRGPQRLVRKVLAPAIKSLCFAAPNSGPSFLEPLKLVLQLPNTDAARKRAVATVPAFESPVYIHWGLCSDSSS